MAELDYETFDLLVERHNGGYQARVLSSPAGNASAVLGEAIPADQFESFLFRVGRPRHVRRRGKDEWLFAEARKFGERLFRFFSLTPSETVFSKAGCSPAREGPDCVCKSD